MIQTFFFDSLKIQSFVCHFDLCLIYCDQFIVIKVSTKVFFFYKELPLYNDPKQKHTHSERDVVTSKGCHRGGVR